MQLIWNSWRRLCPGDAIYKLDFVSVKAVETRCPKYSKADREEIHAQIRQGIIFAAFSCEDRDRIWISLLSIDHLMPSLFTLLRDLHFLQACTDSMRHLMQFPSDPDMGLYTIDAALKQSFRADEKDSQYVIEVASGVIHQAPVPMEDRFDLARRQLWLYAMRNFKRLPQPRRKGGRNLLAKADLEHADETALYEFAVLARRLGFSSSEIEHLGTHLSPQRDPKPNPFATTAQRPARRCGLPSEDSYKRDAPLLFIQNMHREFSDQEITSFFVRRSVYLAFFGPCQFDFTISIGEKPKTTVETALALYRETGEGPDGPQGPPRKRKREQEHSAERENGAMQAYAASSSPVTILFMAFQNHCLTTIRQETVNPMNPAKVEEIAREFTREGWTIFSTKMKPVVIPSDVFDSALSSGLNAVILLPAGNVDINDELQRAIVELLADSQNINQS